MGLDIHIATDNYTELHSGDYYDKRNDYFNKHSLSRTFCDFMCRQNVVSHMPELEQIGNITGVNTQIFYDMERYPDQEYINDRLENANGDDERREILSRAEQDKRKLEGNIDKVLSVLGELIEKIKTIENLPDLLLQTDFDSLDNKEYFADFNLDKGQGYIGNNFGQDLRNFKRFLDFAKARGTTTVWFTYG